MNFKLWKQSHFFQYDHTIMHLTPEFRLNFVSFINQGLHFCQDSSYQKWKLLNLQRTCPGLNLIKLLGLAPLTWLSYAPK